VCGIGAGGSPGTPYGASSGSGASGSAASADNVERLPEEIAALKAMRSAEGEKVLPCVLVRMPAGLVPNG
jgi:hypothetical protein